MQLSDAERDRIRLEEEYRAEVRSKLAGPAPQKGESWLDKLAVPLLIVLVSGLLVPWVLERVEDNHRAFDLQSRLIEQIVADDAAAQAKKEHDAGWAGIAAFQKQLADSSRQPNQALRDCPDEVACERIFRDAAARIEQLGGKPQEFKEWDEARRGLVKFISETRPRL
jgi:hypothetical protein